MKKLLLTAVIAGVDLVLSVMCGPAEDCTRPNTDPTSCPYCSCPLVTVRENTRVAA